MGVRYLSKQAILVTGGAGYIGSHVVWALREAGFRPVVIDNLSTGNRANLPADVVLVEEDVGRASAVRRILLEHQIRAVLHFAGSIVVSESVSDPLLYYKNNTSASRNLVEACLSAGVDKIVFSSTAAVYGTPVITPIVEEAPTAPQSPYGTSKLMTEWLLRDAAAATQIRYVVLRYFNVAGADPYGRSGQSNPAATHLIKVASQVALGLRPELPVYGTDYDTADGTCIRDYIHVTDLADAHVLAVQHLFEMGSSTTLNCGYGVGFSVLDVISAMERASGLSLPTVLSPRRPGDVPSLVADSSRLQRLLGWKPKHQDLEGIITSALEWERILLSGRRPAGRVDDEGRRISA